MLRLAGYRILGTIPVFVMVALGVFALLHLAPGDAASLIAGENSSEADLRDLRALWGLDKPLIVQFGHLLWNSLHFDFGDSYRYHAPASELIAQRLPATLELALAALLIAVLAAIPLGVVMALRAGSFLDALGSVVAVLGVSAPPFWIGILLVLFLSGDLHLLPSGGRLPFDARFEPLTGFVLIDSLLRLDLKSFEAALAHIALPAVTLALGAIGMIARITRSAVVDVVQEDFITTALSKGLERGQIIRRHILPNAAIPIVTVLGLEIGVLISGTIVIEVVFSWPGLGSLLYSAVTVRDVPLTTGIVMTYTLIFILVNLVVDLAYVVFDPRLRKPRA
jgi:peptide/nickel transport system permease protein